MPIAIRSSVLVFALLGLGALEAAPVSAQETKALPIETVPNVPNYAYALAFSFDGARAASGGSDGTVKLWDVPTGRLLRTFSRHSKRVRSIVFSADGRRVTSASDDNAVKLWDATTGQLLRTVSLQEEISRGDVLMISPDGSRVVSGTNKGMRLWDAATGKLLRTFHRERPNSVAFSSDGTRIVSGSSGQVRIWDAATGRLIRTFSGHERFASVDAVAFSADGARIVSASFDKTVKLWDANTGQLLQTFSHSEGLLSVAISPNGARVLSGGYDKTIKLWDAATGRLVMSSSRYSTLFAAAFSPDGKQVLSGSAAIKLWDSDTGRFVRDLGRDREEVLELVFSPNGARIFSGGTSLKAWEAAGGRLLSSVPGPAEDARSVAFSRDATRILWKMADGKTLKLGDAATGRVLATFEGHLKGIASAALSPDGSRALSGGSSYDQTMKLWDTATGRLIRSFTHSNKVDANPVESVAFSPDGARLLSGSYDGSVKLWDAASGQLLWTYKESTIVWRLEFSPDGSRVLAAIGEKLKLLDAATGRLLRAFDGHRSGYITTRAAFSADGSRMLSASHDQTVKLWDVATGRLLRTFETGHVNSVAFSPDGSRALLSNEIWNLDTGERLVSIIDSQDNEWLAITPEGFFVASEHGANMLSIVRGFDVWSIDQFYQSLYRPDLVREKLAGDPRGLVREAAAKLNLTKVLASGNAPLVTLASPRDGTRATAEQVTAEVEIAERGGGIGRVEWRINGVTVGIETPPAPPAGQPLRLTRGLVLDDGENEIEVVAYNGANLVASVPARATITGQAAASRTPARLFVLAVGLNEYAEAKFKLTYAVPDAKALAQALGEAGKGVYESVEVTLVQDADVKRGKLDAMFAELAAKVRASDVFVFFLGGHGKTIDGRYYFIPQDFRIEGGVTKAALDAAVVKQGIAQEEWQAWLARVPARKSVLLFDTCESGSLTGEGKETRALERTAANDRLVQATGRTILTASSDDTDAFEGFRGHGLFTYNVLEALERADSDGNGRIEVAELAAYVYAQVTALSEQVYKQRQVPQVRITGNYSLAKPTQIFAGKEPGIVLPAKATHQVTSAAELLVLPAMGARRVRKLDAKTPVTLVKSDAGWTLIAREGRPLGFVATKDLAPIQ